MVKRFKVFNESNINLNFYLIDSMKMEMKFDFQDILYSFSRFTDEYEWNYDLKFQTHHYKTRLNYYGSNYKLILEAGGIPLKIVFSKEFSINDKISRAIQFGKELELFQKCFIQFRELEEGIRIENCDYTISDSMIEQKAEIHINLIELLPNVIEDFKKKFNL